MLNLYPKSICLVTDYCTIKVSANAGRVKPVILVWENMWVEYVLIILLALLAEKWALKMNASV